MATERGGPTLFHGVGRHMDMLRQLVSAGKRGKGRLEDPL